MKLLIVGSGAREHCLAWKARQSHLVTELYCAPGNAGTAQLASNLSLAADDVEGLADWASAQRIDLTIVGPEGPLVAGIADSFAERGLAIFGPSRDAARIEGSKVWSKELMLKYGIPTAKAAIFDSPATAKAYIARQPMPVVVKADGLAAGKGVIVALTTSAAISAVEQLMERRELGAAGDRVLVEECLTGPEVSVLAFTDGKTVLPLPPACDYKRVADSDEGPNTGGMGAYSPPKFLTMAIWEQIVARILRPTVEALDAEGCPYKGVLYAGLMLAPDGPKALEFNCRFGDPETQVILPRLRSDFVALAMATIEGRLGAEQVDWDDSACCGVVLASGGYPGDYRKGLPIGGVEDVGDDVNVFHAGTVRRGEQVVTNGGRVLTVVAMGASMAEARGKAYEAAAKMRFEGCHYRRDIAARELP